MLSNQLDKEYPKPVGTKWQDEYRYAKAFETACVTIVNFWKSKKDQLKMYQEKENETETSIEDA